MSEMNQNEPGAGTGKGMVIVAWVGVLALLTVVFQSALEDRYNPNRTLNEVHQEGVIPEVVLERNAQGHYVANGRINGMPVVFLLDTGATDVALSETLADKLRLQRQAGGFSQTANGMVPVWGATLQQVSLGNIQLNQVRASIVPSMNERDAVLLGMSFLKRLDMVQSGNTLTLTQVR